MQGMEQANRLADAHRVQKQTLQRAERRELKRPRAVRDAAIDALIHAGKTDEEEDRAEAEILAVNNASAGSAEKHYEAVYLALDEEYTGRAKAQGLNMTFVYGFGHWLLPNGSCSSFYYDNEDSDDDEGPKKTREPLEEFNMATVKRQMKSHMALSPARAYNQYHQELARKSHNYNLAEEYDAKYDQYALECRRAEYPGWLRDWERLEERCRAANICYKIDHWGKAQAVEGMPFTPNKELAIWRRRGPE